MDKEKVGKKMKFIIKHEIKNRIRIQVCQERMSFEQADTIQYVLTNKPFVTSVKVNERTRGVTVCYTGDREDLMDVLKGFRYESAQFSPVF